MHDLPMMLMLGLVAHLIGDYVIQSHWMAIKKTSEWVPAIVHGVTYTLPFLFITLNPVALLIIGGTHIIIDRFRLAKYLAFAKNQLSPKAYRPVWPKQHNGTTALTGVVTPPQTHLMVNKDTGYPADTPAWMAVWLMILADNTLHIVINSLALWMFG